MVKKNLVFILIFLCGCSSTAVREIASPKGCSEIFHLFNLGIQKRMGGESPGKGLVEVKNKDLVIVDSSLREEVERKRRLFNSIVERGEDSSWIKNELGEAKKRLGKGVVNKTFIESAIELDKIIIIRNMNSGANSYIGHKAIMKPAFIKAKTAKYGLIKGLIPFDQNLVIRNMSDELVQKYSDYVVAAMATGNVKKVKLENRSGTAVIRNGRQVMVEEVLPTDKPIYVMADANGDKYTADVDLYSIGGRELDTSSSVYTDELGTTTYNEIESIEAINRVFALHDIHRNIERDLVLHGSEVHNPNPVDLDFPLRVYLPDGRVFDIQSGPHEYPEKYLDSFKAWALTKGYFVK